MKDAPKIARHRCGNNLDGTVANAVQDGTDANAKTMLHGAENGHETVAGNASPLLALEPTGTKKTGENSNRHANLDGQPCYAPLLGTSTSQVLGIFRGSSRKRSPESICYPQLLRENGPSSGRKSRKIAPVEGHVCYGKVTGTGD